MLSRACQIGLRSMLYLTSRSGAAFVNAKEISQVLGESPHFVAKVLHQLAAGGLLHSYRGPNGGVALIRRPESITLSEVVDLIDGANSVDRCLLGKKECSSENPCMLHHEWGPIKANLLDMLQTRSLRDIADQAGPMTKFMNAIPAPVSNLRQKTPKTA